MKTILPILLALEAACPMFICAPAPPKALAAARCRGWPQAKLWSITNGCEINVPGTVLWSLEEAQTETAPPGWFPLGRMTFGDNLFIAKTGQITQVDHTDGSVFLTWPDLDSFLREELSILREV